MMSAAMCMSVRKLSSVLSKRAATARNSFRLAKKFSIRWRKRYMALQLAGMTAMAPQLSSSALQPIDIETLVPEQSVKGDARDKRRNAERVVVLAGQEREAHQVSYAPTSATIFVVRRPCERPMAR